jgi:hypothetical protein
MLGVPGMIKKTDVAALWVYGPDIDAMLQGDPGCIVGVTITFRDGVVADVTQSRKTTHIQKSE